jgi:O-antigen/teichoic acid export membrane protein
MLRQTFQYSIASVVSAVVGLLSAVCFTRLITPEGYGIYVVGLSTAGVVSAVLFTWVRVSTLRFQSEGGSVDLRKTGLAAYLIAVLASPLALALATLLSKAPVERSLAATGFALGLGFFELGQEFLRSRLQSFNYMMASITRACLMFVLGLAAACWGGGGLELLIMTSLAYFITTLLFAPIIWRGPLAPVNLEALKDFARFGVPMTVSGLVFALHSALDRLLVFHFMGDAAAGQYGASADLVRQIILLPAASIASASVPLAFRAYANDGEDAARGHMETSLEILLAAIVPAVVGFAMTSNFVAGIVLGSDYRQTAYEILPILVFAWLFQSLTQYFVHVSFHLAKKPGLITLQGVGMLAMNLVVMPLMIIRFGLIGAAVALVITEVFGTSLGWFLARRAFALPFNGWHVTRIGLATAAMALVLAGLKLILPGGLPSFCILVAAGSATYLAAAAALDIAGIRKPLLARLRTGRVAVTRQIAFRHAHGAEN